MDNFTVGALVGITASTVALHVTAFLLLLKLKRATRLIERKENEIMMLTFLLERSKHRLHETTDCAEDMYKALHKASFYCDEKYFNTSQIERISERFKEIQERNAALAS